MEVIVIGTTPANPTSNRKSTRTKTVQCIRIFGVAGGACYGRCCRSGSYDFVIVEKGNWNKGVETLRCSHLRHS